MCVICVYTYIYIYIYVSLITLPQSARHGDGDPSRVVALALVASRRRFRRDCSERFGWLPCQESRIRGTLTSQSPPSRRADPAPEREGVLH